MHTNQQCKDNSSTLGQLHILMSTLEQTHTHAHSHTHRGQKHTGIAVSNIEPAVRESI